LRVSLGGSGASSGPRISLLVTLDAEDAFDVEDQLPRVTAHRPWSSGDKDVFYTRELFEGTAAGVQDGRAHILQDWGHVRTSGSNATTNLILGFLLAGLPLRPGN
jgi:hypothetical protein